MAQLAENTVLDESIQKVEVLNHNGETTSFYNEVEKHKENNEGIVVFTYPKANTPGCTKQAELFKEKHEEFVNNKYVVYGLSADTAEDQVKQKRII
ncbi:hypothetical protein PFTANZ_03041 [Plasmodium falciparum Tanzania (2000708)]|uniref:Alkyl hydroperoxide reductase subunit C/ Thiol specific antioxidant domain-containing protein n=1 Tax=Plasmodium falciparum Tanzania (2000708) TaxID=1036725 RepID=A0A024W5N3_PLAFA|nr:hypothetical protein PFTANZ_03041 [Plasmodium falciparum Tanzania (2000708)]